MGIDDRRSVGLVDDDCGQQLPDRGQPAFEQRQVAQVDPAFVGAVEIAAARGGQAELERELGVLGVFARGVAAADHLDALADQPTDSGAGTLFVERNLGDVDCWKLLLSKGLSIGIIAGALPAFAAMRLRTAEALRRNG